MQSPFDPRDFLTLARHLCDEDRSEARLRTAISRAYYASMLLARVKTGVSEQRHIHKIVQGALKKLNSPLAQKLADLERLRGLADYHLVLANSLDADWDHNWKRAESLANDIVMKLDALSPP